MATPATNAFQTYGATGIREDLIDVITNIDPVDTFCLNKFATGKATNTYHQWQTDTLAAPTANAQIEGDDISASAITATSKLGNYCQILRKAFRITDTQEAVEKAGRKSEIAYQTQKVLKELARDIEYAMVINTAAASGASATARTMKGVLGWVTGNHVTATATSDYISEIYLNNCLQQVWADGGKPSTVLCGAVQKRKISAFTTNTRNVVADEKKLTSAVDVYQSDFGTVMIKLHQILNTSAAGSVIVFGDMNLWKKCWLRPIKREELARTGASKAYFVEAELTIESRQELGSGKLTGFLTT
jgi:hypothetical protein